MSWASAEVIKAVERQGFRRKEGKGRRGTHRVWARPGKPGDKHNTCVIPLDKNRIPDGTMASILRQLGVDETTLRGWLMGPAVEPSPVGPPKVSSAKPKQGRFSRQSKR